jgi:hypothetical protein
VISEDDSQISPMGFNLITLPFQDEIQHKVKEIKDVDVVDDNEVIYICIYIYIYQIHVCLYTNMYIQMLIDEIQRVVKEFKDEENVIDDNEVIYTYLFTYMSIIYIYIYIDAHMHIYIYIYIYIHMCISCVCHDKIQPKVKEFKGEDVVDDNEVICVYVYVYHIYVCICHIFVCTQICIYISVYQVYVRVYHTHICTQIYIYVYFIYVQQLDTATCELINALTFSTTPFLVYITYMSVHRYINICLSNICSSLSYTYICK